MTSVDISAIVVVIAVYAMPATALVLICLDAFFDYTCRHVLRLYFTITLSAYAVFGTVLALKGSVTGFGGKLHDIAEEYDRLVRAEEGAKDASGNRVPDKSDGWARGEFGGWVPVVYVTDGQNAENDTGKQKR